MIIDMFDPGICGRFMSCIYIHGERNWTRAQRLPNEKPNCMTSILAKKRHDILGICTRSTITF